MWDESEAQAAVVKQIVKDFTSARPEVTVNVEFVGIEHDSRVVLKKLEDAGLISSVKDGNRTRYFPSTLIEKTIKTQGSRLKEFRRTLLKRMEKEYLKPEIEEIKGNSLVIILKIFEPPEEIIISYRPIEAILTQE